MDHPNKIRSDNTLIRTVKMRLVSDRSYHEFRMKLDNMRNEHEKTGSNYGTDGEC